jgi:hypothetical protein
MPATRILVLATAASLAAAVSAQETIDGSAPAIRSVVAGHTCLGNDTLKFGASSPGVPGVFERNGRPAATYSIGYGTILVRRGDDVHGHVASVSPLDGTLYLSTGTYRCGK